jgi:ABC-2 type transport system permease protein
VGDVFVSTITAPPEDLKDNTYDVERVAGSLQSVRAVLNKRVEAKEIDGYVALPPDILDSNKVVYRARSIANMNVLRDLRQAASRAVQAERLRRAGLDGSQVASLIKPVTVQEARITQRGEEAGGALSTFFFAYIVAFLIYFMTVFYGTSVLRSVLEEKTNRIAEVMVSSVKPVHLMAGKIIGVGSAAVLQVLIWIALMVLATRSKLITDRLDVSPETLSALSVEPWVAVAFTLFFVLGFFLYSSLFAALGAAVTSDQEAQSLQMVVMLPLIVPLMFLLPITNEPLGAIATTLGLIPLTAPLAMPMRMAATEIPVVQILASILLLALGVALLAWLAGKIYRVGILSTGKKATLRELVQWLQAS